MLQMCMSLTGDIVHNISHVLLPAATDEVFLRRSVLEKHIKKEEKTHTHDVFLHNTHFNLWNYLRSSAAANLASVHTRVQTFYLLQKESLKVQSWFSVILE